MAKVGKRPLLQLPRRQRSMARGRFDGHRAGRQAGAPTRVGHQEDRGLKVRELERRRDAGAVTTSSKTTVAAWVARWIGKRETLGSVRRRTLDGYRVDERHIVAAIGPVRLERLRAVHVEHLWKSMVDAGRVGSYPHCRRTLMATLNEAVQRWAAGTQPSQAGKHPASREP